MVLIGLLNKYFVNNLNLKFPKHIIHVRKQDVLNIDMIFFLYDYSRVKLTGSSIIDLSKLVILSKLNINYLI